MFALALKSWHIEFANTIRYPTFIRPAGVL